MQPSVASRNSENPVSSTGRRPKRSASGPTNSCSTALTARNSATESCITRYSVWKYSVMFGSDGRNTFIDSADVPTMRISVAM